jgi:hypothetical protein
VGYGKMKMMLACLLAKRSVKRQTRKISPGRTRTKTLVVWTVPSTESVKLSNVPNRMVVQYLGYSWMEGKLHYLEHQMRLNPL